MAGTKDDHFDSLVVDTLDSVRSLSDTASIVKLTISRQAINSEVDKAITALSNSADTAFERAMCYLHTIEKEENLFHQKIIKYLLKTTKTFSYLERRIGKNVSQLLAFKALGKRTEERCSIIRMKLESPNVRRLNSSRISSTFFSLVPLLQTINLVCFEGLLPGPPNNIYHLSSPIINDHAPKEVALKGSGKKMATQRK